MIPIGYNVRSLLLRRATSLAAVLGIALVVFVLSASLMLGAGIAETLNSAGHDDQAIVIRKGSDAELNSGVEIANVALIGAAPGVASENGQPMVVGEVVVVAAMNKIGGDGTGVSNVTIRGVPESVYRLRPEVRFIRGTAPRPGVDEAAVGARIAGSFQGLELGQSVELRKNRTVKVVGVFEDGGSSFESEIWADVDTVRAAFGREGMVSAVRVRLESPAAFDAFEKAVEGDKRLGLEAKREVDYFDAQGEGTSVFITAMGSVISFFFAAGAIIGAMITMYASVAHRQKEIGTLRALGFRRRTILGSFLLESTLLALIGGAIGTLASLSLGLATFSMMNQSSWSEMVFSFTPTVGTIGTALFVSLAMGLFGGFLPALRAARMQPVAAMRD